MRAHVPAAVSREAVTMLLFLEQMQAHWMPWCGLLLGLFAPVSIHAHRREAYLWGEITAYLAAIGLFGLIVWHWQGNDVRFGWAWFVFMVGGLVLAFWWYRFGVPSVDQFKDRLTKRSNLVRVGRTDVRTVAQELPSPRKEYDPRRFHRAGNYFLGMDSAGKPIYWGGVLPHTCIAGTSGAGKGRKLQDLSAQSILNGEALFYLDPKDDEWGPHALFAACQEHAAAYHYLRLLPESSVQINLLEGAKAWEIEELFHAALGLADVGAGSDFYRAKDRHAAHEAAAIAACERMTIAQLYQRMATDEYWQEESPGFLGKLGELAQVDAINAKCGAFSISDVIAHGGGVYVVGSMTLQGVKRAQQMIFVRVQQIATARDRMEGKQRTVSVIADEAKYHISRPVLQGLGASRDKGMRVVLAFQSFTDLKDCPDDLNPDMVVGAIVENTPCKLIYRLEDPDTADWLARKSGVVLVDDQARTLEKNIALAETALAERTIRQGEHFLFDTNKLMNLPAGWSVLFGQGVAQACYISAYRVTKSLVAITPMAATVAQAEAEGDFSESVRAVPLPLPKVGGKNSSGHTDDDFFSLE